MSSSSANLFRLSTNEFNVSRISNIEQCFGDNGIPLLRTGRVLIAEGVLLKVCRKKPKRRQFFLFNDLLVYGNIIIGRKKYTKQQIIELDDVRAQMLPNEENAFQVMSPKKSFTVYTNTSLEASKWVEYINKYAKDCADRLLPGGAGGASVAASSPFAAAGGPGTQQGAEAAPVWIPDKEQQRCMVCQVGFTVINRRHHCRRCGRLVCQACSGRKWLLPAQSKKPVRVCANCHAILLQPAASASIGATPAPSSPPPAAAAAAASAVAAADGNQQASKAAIAAAAAAAAVSAAEVDAASSSSECNSD